MELKPRRALRARRERPLLMLGVVCLVLTAACGGAGDNAPGAAATTTATASATTAATPSVSTTATASMTTAAAMQACADAAALKASANNLDQLNPREAGKSGVQAALHDARIKLEAVKVSSAGRWGDQVSELEAALDALEEAVAAVGGGNLFSQLPTIVNRAEQLEQAWKGLEREIDASCPS